MAPPKPGDRLPLDVRVWIMSPEDKNKPVAVTLRELLKGKRRSVLVGIPGPFTPGVLSMDGGTCLPKSLHGSSLWVGEF